MRAAHKPVGHSVFKLLAGSRGHFEAFCPIGMTHCFDGIQPILPRQISLQHGFMTCTFLL